MARANPAENALPRMDSSLVYEKRKEVKSYSSQKSKKKKKKKDIPRCADRSKPRDIYSVKNKNGP